jgi:hypothetical protein
MDYRKMYSSKTLHDFDLMDENGKAHDRTLVIEKCQQGELTSEGNKKDKLPLITFRGEPKQLGVNKTNGKTIAGMYGKDTRQWAGKSITLYATTTKFGPNTVGCIRVRPNIPSGTETNAGPASVDLSEPATSALDRIEAARSTSELDAVTEDIKPAVSALPEREKTAVRNAIRNRRARLESEASA